MTFNDEYIFITNNFRVHYWHDELFQLLNNITQITREYNVLLETPGHTLISENKNNMLLITIKYKGGGKTVFPICSSDKIGEFKNKTFKNIIERLNNEE